MVSYNKIHQNGSIAGVNQNYFTALLQSGWCAKKGGTTSSTIKLQELSKKEFKRKDNALIKNGLQPNRWVRSRATNELQK